MALLEWKDSYRTGVGAIDYEHENLISAINSLYGKAEGSGDAEELAGAVGNIHALIEAHFALEEKIMRDSNYPAYTEHKIDHDRLLDEILDIMDTIEESGKSPEVLGDSLHSWFKNHFSTLDRDLHVLSGL